MAIIKCKVYSCSKEAKFVIDPEVGIREAEDEADRRFEASQRVYCGIHKGGINREKYSRKHEWALLSESTAVRMLAQAFYDQRAADAATERAENEVKYAEKVDKEYAAAWSLDTQPYFIIPMEVGEYDNALLQLEVRPLTGRSGWGPRIKVEQRKANGSFRSDDGRLMPAFVDCNNLSRMTGDEARKIAEALIIAADFVDKTNKESAPNG